MFTSFILKLTGYCNLNCSYCYMFNSRDRTFTRKPRAMTAETARAALARIAEHARAHAIPRVAIALHGGEPTLWPVHAFRALFADVAALRAEGLEIELALQTNMFKPPRSELLDLFGQGGVGLGISLDGPKTVNDGGRVDFAGRGSHDRILRNVRALIAAGHAELIGGFLCVMRPDLPPEDFLDWLDSLPIRRATLLWPLERNQAHPPWIDERSYAREPRYGSWLAALFEAWLARDRLDLEIRFFNDTMQALLGGPPPSDDIGPWAFHSLVINTDGAIELSDYLRTSADGATETGFDVARDPFDRVADSLDFRARHAAARAQPRRCANCAHWRACGGGTLSGRLDASGAITAEPSVLCHDHRHFYDAVAARLAAAQAA